MKARFLHIPLLLALLTCTESFAQSGQEPVLPEASDSVFTFPEILLSDSDSLLDQWYNTHYLTSDNECIDGSVIPEIPDSVYRQRMKSLPCIIDMPYNQYVRNAIDRYMVKGRRSTASLIGLFPLYEDIFVETLLKYGMPVELKYLPIIEAALKPRAYSRAGAAGMWQFVYSTGRKYDLKVNSLIDDRYDVAKSTDAAARHLKDLYDIYGDWGLAISAYNCGPGNVNKAIARSGGKKDFWSIYPYLPRETRGYLPSFIAMNYVMEYYKEHNICPAHTALTLATDTLHISRNLHYGQISAFCGISNEEIKAYNPQYLSDIVPGNYRTCVLTLPTKYIKPLIEAGDSLYAFNQETYFPKEKNSYIDDEMTNKVTYITHKIKNGETLSSIAIKYHTSVKNIKQWNNMSSDKIRAGKTLRIYSR